VPDKVDAFLLGAYPSAIQLGSAGGIVLYSQGIDRLLESIAGVAAIPEDLRGPQGIGYKPTSSSPSRRQE
jgi:hypothetical protein